jgi:hypothetical protein
VSETQRAALARTAFKRKSPRQSATLAEAEAKRAAGQGAEGPPLETHGLDHAISAPEVFGRRIPTSSANDAHGSKPVEGYCRGLHAAS